MRRNHLIVGICAAAMPALLVLGGCQQQSATSSVAPSATASSATAAPASLDRAAFEKDVADWRSGRVARLRKPDGWLSLVGLHWVEPGVHQLGMADSNDVQLRTGPAKLGTLTLKDGKAMFKPDADAGVAIDDKPAAGD